MISENGVISVNNMGVKIHYLLFSVTLASCFSASKVLGQSQSACEGFTVSNCQFDQVKNTNPFIKMQIEMFELLCLVLCRGCVWHPWRHRGCLHHLPGTGGGPGWQQLLPVGQHQRPMHPLQQLWDRRLQSGVGICHSWCQWLPARSWISHMWRLHRGKDWKR